MVDTRFRTERAGSFRSGLGPSARGMRRFGIFGHPTRPRSRARLHALQHRGQEAAGIVSYDGKRFNSERRHGHGRHAFSKASTIERLPGDRAIAMSLFDHRRNHSPQRAALFAELDSGGFAVAPQRTSTNALTLRAN